MPALRGVWQWPGQRVALTSLGSTVLRFQIDAIVDGVPEPLLAANISFGGLDALVPEEELDSLDLACQRPAEAGPTYLISTVSNVQSCYDCDMIGMIDVMPEYLPS